MNVKELKELLEKVPDNYEVRTRPYNAHFHKDEAVWELYFSAEIIEIKPIHSHKILMLIRGFE